WATRTRGWIKAASGELALDLARRVGLEDVAFLEVGVVAQHDAALEPGRHLARILVEAPQAGDLPVPDDRSVAHQADLRAAGDLALGDIRAGDRPHARGAEDLAHLGAAQR